MPIPPLPPERLRWQVPAGVLDFASTAEVEPLQAFIGQDEALRALTAGVGMRAHGYNVFVVGPLSTGRLSTIHRIIHEASPPRRTARDFVYVRNVLDPSRPQLIEFPAGRALAFRKELLRLAAVLVEEMPRILNAAPIRHARERQRHSMEVAQRAALVRLEAHARELGFVIASEDPDEAALPVPLWLVAPKKGEEGPTPLSRADLLVRVESGSLKLRVPLDEVQRRFDVLEEELASALDQAREVALATLRKVSDAEQDAVRAGTRGFFRDLARRWPCAKVWVHALHEELVGSPEWFDEENPDHDALFAAFTVNCVHIAEKGRRAPVIPVTSPTWARLFGGIEGEPGEVDHRSLRGGALLDADGGFLVVDAADMLQEPGVWKMLKRLLMYGETDIQNADSPSVGQSALRPDSLRLDVKLVLVGDPATYAALYYSDLDVRSLFKVKAEFEDDAPATVENLHNYVRFLARLCKKERLGHLDAAAVGRVLEWAVRASGRGGCITTKLGQVSDVVREASYAAGGRAISLAHVEHALEARRRRDNLAERRTLELLDRGVLRVETAGSRTGTVNGLVVYHLGGHDFGRPLRITATAGVGRSGIVSVERDVGLSGRAHDKGVRILAGLVRERLGRVRTLAVTASVTFEQSYGRIDGDSASVAELVALVSAISGLPVRQDVALTGSTNQLGEVQAVGGINEKIEGFYEACRLRGLTGSQGVVIPAANVPELCLVQEIVDEVARGRFAVWAADGVDEILTHALGVDAEQVWARAGEALDHMQAVSRLQGRRERERPPAP